MNHWNFYPSLLALAAIFWWRFVDLRIEETKIDGSRPKIEIKSPSLDGPMNFGVPPIPPLFFPDEPTFNPKGRNSAESPKSSGLSKAT